MWLLCDGQWHYTVVVEERRAAPQVKLMGFKRVAKVGQAADRTVRHSKLHPIVQQPLNLQPPQLRMLPRADILKSSKSDPPTAPFCVC